MGHRTWMGHLVEAWPFPRYTISSSSSFPASPDGCASVDHDSSPSRFVTECGGIGGGCRSTLILFVRGVDVLGSGSGWGRFGAAKLCSRIEQC